MLETLDIVIMGIEALLSSHRSKYRIPIPGEVVEGDQKDSTKTGHTFEREKD